MTILIFGGGNSFIEYYNFCVDYWKEAEICAILDNDEEKWGGNMYGINIVPPDNIYQYEYDVILICSVYEKEIEKQLIDEYDVNKEKIETRRHFFDEVIFLWYEKKYKNKKILVMGEKFKFDILRQLYYEFFNVVGFVSLDEIAMVNNYNYDYILLTNCGGRKNEFSVVNKIIQSGYIRNKRILKNEIFLIYRNHIEHFSYGRKYPEKKFLLICIGGCGAGLGAICRDVINNVCYADQNDFIPIIDMKTYKTQYIEEEEYGIVNAWEKFFFQPTEYALKDIKEAKFVSKVFAGIKWGTDCKSIKQSWFPKMKYHLLEKYKRYLKKIGSKRVLGVLFRGTDYSRQKPFGLHIQPDLGTVINIVRKKIEEWGKFDLIFLCTEVQQACDRFEEEFGEKVVYYPQLRFDAETNIVRLALYSFGVQGERTKRGEDYWVALNILASCNSIIAGQCSGTDIALKINNNKYEKKYIFNLGRYGIDD